MNLFAKSHDLLRRMTLMAQNPDPGKNANRSNADPAQQYPEPAQDGKKSSGIHLSWHVIIGLILLLPAVIFAFINSQLVTISVVFKEFQAPLILIILSSIAIGSISTLLVSWNIRRKRAKKQRSQISTPGNHL
ncbi:MAG: DUF1049 domain-containing protein [Clostridia bacterium]|nr:DUF1049 domain-containing protein [Clostridia bacterium]